MVSHPTKKASISRTVVVVAVLGLFCWVYLQGGSSQSDPLKFNKMTSPYPEPKVLYEVLPPQESRKQHILITGGAGFIGSQLGYHLHKMGYEVSLLDNMEFGYSDNLEVDGHKFGRFIKADVMDPRIIKYLEGVDVIFHFAALSALPVCQVRATDAMAINVGGVANILDGARRLGVRRVIFASTSAVYENNKETPFLEDAPVNPHLVYSLSKYQAELLCHAFSHSYNQEVVVLRFFNVYGPHQDFRRKSPPFTSYVIRELLNNRVPVLHSNGLQRRDYVHVMDLVRMAVIVMTHPKAPGQTFNVASGKPYSVNEIYDILANATGSKIRPTYRDSEHFWDAYPELFEGARHISKEVLIKEVNKFSFGSAEKGEKLLGWKAQVSMEDGLKEMVDYVKKKQAKQMTGKFDAAWN